MGVCFFLLLLILITDLLVFDKREPLVLAILRIFLISFLAYFIPSLIKRLKDIYEKNRINKEIDFLKRLFVILASVKLIDFNQLIKILIDKSKLLKEDLEAIYEMTQKSNIDKEDFYRQLREKTKNLDQKIFYEKLDMAYNYDFDLAVKSIKNDFAREKRENYRRVKKRVEGIHILGVTGLFIVMTVLVVYLLGPWLEMLKIDTFGW